MSECASAAIKTNRTLPRNARLQGNAARKQVFLLAPLLADPIRGLADVGAGAAGPDQQAITAASAPKVLKALRRQFCVAHGVLDVPMAQIGPQAIVCRAPCWRGETAG